MRDLLEGTVAAAGGHLPRGSVQSNSLLATTIALVAESDMVAAVSERAITLPERNRTLRRLPFHLGTKSEVTMYWRRENAGSALVAALLDALREVSRRPAKQRRAGVGTGAAPR